MTQPIIKVNNLSKVFYSNFTDNLREAHLDKKRLSKEDKFVLDDLSFVFNFGETIGIIGRNGAGKSTLLSILAGVSKQTSGEVNITGKVTAVMTLGLGLREDLTGRENIYLDGEIQGKTRLDINKIIDEIIEFAELDEFIDKPIKTYSTGMKSRLSFSMLVGIEPEILIIDEALSAGDVFFAQKASQKIKDICKKGKIVIIVSHSMETIKAMCNRCIWLENGVILMDDTPEIVTYSYLEKIKSEDQVLAVKNYQKNTSLILDEAKFKIVDVVLGKLGSDYQQNVFFTKDSLALIIGIKKEPRILPAILNFTIERIDGLVVCLEQFDLSKQNDIGVLSSFSLELYLEHLVINKGYYQIKLEIIEKGKITNQFIRFFEIKNYNISKGGASLLQYPAEIITTNKGVLCLDSLDLITE